MVSVREDLTAAFEIRTARNRRELFVTKRGDVYAWFNAGTLRKQVVEIWAFSKTGNEGTYHARRVSMDNEVIPGIEFYRLFTKKTDNPAQTTVIEDGKAITGYVHEYASRSHMVSSYRSRIESGEISLDDKRLAEFQEIEKKLGL